MEKTDKFVSEAWEALIAAEDQRHSEAPHRHGCVTGSEEAERLRDIHQCHGLIESLSVNHQNDGEESSEGRSSVAAARSTLEQRLEAVRVAVQTGGGSRLWNGRWANGGRPGWRWGGG